MSHQLLRVRPTKIELIRLKRRLAIARRLHKVLKDRLIILSQELIFLVREASSIRRRLHDVIVECEENYLVGLHLDPPFKAVRAGEVRYRGVEAVVGSRVVAGVRVPMVEVEVKEGDFRKEYYSVALSRAVDCMGEVLKYIAKLSEIEVSIVLIGKEVSRTKRRVNALENVLIPRMENTIKYLQMKFEEREREDKTRLKKVKEILEKRAAGSE